METDIVYCFSSDDYCLYIRTGDLAEFYHGVDDGEKTYTHLYLVFESGSEVTIPVTWDQLSRFVEFMQKEYKWLD